MLSEIYDYIYEHNQSAAGNYIDGIYASVKKLEKHPEFCAPCRNEKLKEAGYRCCRYKKHIIIYEFLPPKIKILAVIHSSRNPKSFGDLID